ncbi:MAG TPA: adenylate/guanylate cyclase domain-containing protein [Gemmataceae bacterium]|nr:adenylate/guanylate cyclase domain-containing protein [Gemmataceae bacterium]
MSDPLTIRVFEDQRLVHTVEALGPVELGRQSTREEEVYRQTKDSGSSRIVIAPLQEDIVSRKHVRLEPLADRKVRITNVSDKRPVRLADGTALKPKAFCELSLPTVLTLGTKTIQIQGPAPDPQLLHSLDEMTLAPGSFAARGSAFMSLSIASTAGIEAEAVVRWLQTTLGLLHSAASSSDFLSKAAQAGVELVGLDSGRVLLLDGDDWKVEAVHIGPQTPSSVHWEPSRQVLQRLRAEKKTFWQSPDLHAQGGGSLLGITAVVAAPVLDSRGEVIGALYGDRRQGSKSIFSGPITRLQALLVELLATCVAAGLARLEQEQAALSARVRFEQFFTPELARNLAEQPDLLRARDAEVTILFCDIRGYSRISERMGTTATVSWISDVLEELSDCVLAHQGVLVDYIGDELMAMWGAPEKQADHPLRACRAALDMLDHLAELNERWQEKLGEPIGLGIGINTGVASVGNVGSHRKFKYGPQGDAVNLASRVQGATKFLKTKLLVTGSTRAHLGDEFRCRRLGRVRVVNIVRPVDIHEIVPMAQNAWAVLQRTYEQALDDFERKEFRNAARGLGNLLIEYPEDGPSLVLLSRAVNALIEEPKVFDPVWDLPGK